MFFFGLYNILKDVSISRSNLNIRFLGLHINPSNKFFLMSSTVSNLRFFNVDFNFRKKKNKFEKNLGNESNEAEEVQLSLF